MNSTIILGDDCFCARLKVHCVGTTIRNVNRRKIYPSLTFICVVTWLFDHLRSRNGDFKQLQLSLTNVLRNALVTSSSVISFVLPLRPLSPVLAGFGTVVGWSGVLIAWGIVWSGLFRLAGGRVKVASSGCFGGLLSRITERIDDDSIMVVLLERVVFRIGVSSVFRLTRSTRRLYEFWNVLISSSITSSEFVSGTRCLISSFDNCATPFSITR